MNRTLWATLLAVSGWASVAPAQNYYHAGYTSNYAPSYSTYSYRSGYGPLGVLNPRTWFGPGPYPTAYASPYYGSGTTYTASYAPTYGYTASYSPLMTTSYYAPAVMSPTVVASAACCSSCSSCCSSCGPCASCPAGGCATGNCALNYAPSATLRPEPDPASSGSSASSGTRSYESESGSSPSNPPNGAGVPSDGFRPYDRSNDGVGPQERGAGYRPEEKIERKAPDTMNDAADDKAEPEAGPPDGAKPAPGAGGTAPPDSEPDAGLPALNLDTKITSLPSPLRGRTRMKARFGSPQLVRAEVDPTLLRAPEIQLVRK